MRTPRTLVALAIAATPLAACGGTDDSTAADTAERSDTDDRTVTLTMTDNAFGPAELTVGTDETVTFEFVNDGQATHEAYLGSEEEQATHAAEMAEAGTADEHSMHMGDGHMDDERLVTVEPGERARLTETFDEPGTVVIGCHRPGHWESGMKAIVTVR